MVALQPDELQLIVPDFGLFVGTPVESVMSMVTVVPRHTSIRAAVIPSEAGATMFPVMKWATLELFDSF